MKYVEKYGVSEISKKYNMSPSYIYFWKTAETEVYSCLFYSKNIRTRHCLINGEMHNGESFFRQSRRFDAAILCV